MKSLLHVILLCTSLAAKNGIYLYLVKDVRDAFEGSPLVKINCQGLHASDYKKIGAKLKVHEASSLCYVHLCLFYHVCIAGY